MGETVQLKEIFGIGNHLTSSKMVSCPEARASMGNALINRVFAGRRVKLFSAKRGILPINFRTMCCGWRLAVSD